MDYLYWHISTYMFTPIKHPVRWRERLRIFLSLFDAKGTILISPEGLNVALSISAQGLTALRGLFAMSPETRSMPLKLTTLPQHGFSRLTVKIKPHLIPFTTPAQPKTQRRSISAQELDASYDKFLMLDVRNDYEVRLGTFRNAQSMNIRHFTDLPTKLQSMPESLKKKKTVIFCTGGIRCEKASSLMDTLGFEDVYQLEGGIVEYLRNTKENNWKGDCFTFDRRVSLTQKLLPGAHTMCFACRAPLSKTDKKSPHYKENVSCPYCKPNTSPHLSSTRV